VRLRNLTPHRLHILDHTGATLLDLPAEPDPARIIQTVLNEEHLPSGVPIRTIRYGSPIALPDPTAETLLVVSRVVAQHLHRIDLLFPDGEIRDPDGRIVACQALARFHR
jgi:hypothetical protein